MKYTIPAVIFAGGKSSRMGRDKALLPFAGFDSLAQYQYARLQKLFEKVYLSAKEDKFDFDAALIPDRYEASSPLSGILSVFETLDADEVFILSVDAPFVDEKVIGTLLEENEKDVDAVIAQSPSGLEPLCGIYKRSLLPMAQEYFRADRHRLTQLLKEAKSKVVVFREDDPFLNLNHPHEYAEVLKRQ